jgi:hypothetical protein
MSVADSDGGDGSSITVGVDLGHGGFGEIAAIGVPFVVHVGQYGADWADDSGLVGENPDQRARRLISLFTRSDRYSISASVSSQASRVAVSSVRCDDSSRSRCGPWAGSCPRSVRARHYRYE